LSNEISTRLTGYARAGVPRIRTDRSNVTITGHGFGTNPSLTITGPGVSGYSTGAASDTQIVANVTIAANSPGGAATVEVQSHGYTVSGLWITSACRPKFTVAVAALAIVA
jgi:hypothetical protein